MKRRLFLLAACCGLAACATPPKLSESLANSLLGRDSLRDFAIEARFSLKVARLGDAVQNASGRLAWEHQKGEDRVFLANPLGVGLAEIKISPQLSQLRTANGEAHENTDADLLMQQVTGYPLPVSRLAGWLLGRSTETGDLIHDTLGRPLRLHEAGWQIEYLYADETPAALPFRLNISRADEVILNLRIEEWRDIGREKP